MDKFGDVWVRHWEKIEANWRRLIGEADLVLVPGDHSWGLKLQDALPDLEFIARLPGHKVLSKGNHDLWWNSLGKLQKLNLPDVYWLQNNSHRFDGICIAGTRGWALPGTEFCKTEEDHTIYEREVARLKLSLESLPKEGRRVGMLHYPPLLKDIRDTGFTELFEAFGVDRVVYGHLHLGHLARAFEGVHNGVTYTLVSCDVMNFVPVEI